MPILNQGQTQTHLVIGPPGTGKTQYLSRQTAIAVAKYGREKVLISSLTRNGAREIAKRVDLPDAQVGTMHRILYHALGAPDIAEGHLKDWNENFAQWVLSSGATVDDIHSREPGAIDGDAMMQELSRFRTQGVPREAWTSTLCEFADAWEDWKASCGYWDFTDLLERGYDLEKAPGDPAVFFLDEAQDFGQLELGLAKKWADHMEALVLAGDGHQTLMGFRGSDPQVMFQVAASRHVLEQSHRVPRAVHAVAMRWMGHTGLPRVDYRPRDADGLVRHGAATYQQGSVVIPDIEAQLERGRDVMLLVTCNYMLDPLLKSLREAGLPYHNPWRVNNGKWNPLAPRKGNIFSDRVLAFLRPDEAIWDEDARFWSGTDLKAWAKALPVKGVFQRGAKAQIERISNDMDDTEVAKHLREWFTEGAMDRIVALDLDWYLHHAEGGAISKPLVQAIVSRRGAKQLREQPKVIVSTVHAAKGAEASVVFLWPDISPAAYYGNHDELGRVFYVGVTRAKEELVLMQGSSGMSVSW